MNWWRGILPFACVFSAVFVITCTGWWYVVCASGVIQLGSSDNPFSGEVSLVQAWCRELSNADISDILLAENTATDAQDADLLVDWSWGAYTSGDGQVVRKSPSMRGKKSCGPGEQLQDDTCVQVQGRHVLVAWLECDVQNCQGASFLYLILSWEFHSGAMQYTNWYLVKSW